MTSVATAATSRCFCYYCHCRRYGNNSHPRLRYHHHHHHYHHHHHRRHQRCRKLISTIPWSLSAIPCLRHSCRYWKHPAELTTIGNLRPRKCKLLHSSRMSYLMMAPGTPVLAIEASKGALLFCLRSNLCHSFWSFLLTTQL